MDELDRGLTGYVRAVAEAVGVPAEGTSLEISDTATAYVGLARRWSERPGQDLMLVWNERHGWFVAVETDPGEGPMVLAYFGGSDPVPAPGVVARFVTDVVAGQDPGNRRPAFGAVEARNELAARLDRYAIDQW